MSCPNEIEDEIYAELEAKLGRGATFEEYRDVAERQAEEIAWFYYDQDPPEPTAEVKVIPKRG